MNSKLKFRFFLAFLGSAGVALLGHALFFQWAFAELTPHLPNDEVAALEAWPTLFRSSLLFMALLTVPLGVAISMQATFPLLRRLRKLEERVYLLTRQRNARVPLADVESLVDTTTVLLEEFLQQEVRAKSAAGEQNPTRGH